MQCSGIQCNSQRGDGYDVIKGFSDKFKCILTVYLNPQMTHTHLVAGFEPEREVATFSRCGDDLSLKILRLRQNCPPQ